MSKRDYRTWVEIDQKIFKNNLKIFKKRMGKGTLLAMVKCNAYGHGLVESAKICQEAKVRFLGVDNIDEAIELRENGIKLPILIITFTPKHRLKDLLKYDVSQVVYDLNTIEEMAKIAGKKKFNIHLKFDTGMSRQGIFLEEAEKYIQAFRKYKGHILFEGILTHFANADDLKNTRYAKQQLKTFLKIVEYFKKQKFFPKYVHGFNTAGALSPYLSKNNSTMFRPGIGIYGLTPSPDFKPIFKKLKLKPVLSWKTRIIQIKTIKKGVSIGYSITEKAQRDLKVALLPVGYYHGIPRLYSSIGHVLIAGQRCRILGRVSMNLTIVDISHLKKQPKVWDEVTIIGQQSKEEITADEFADKVNTINYEVVTRINPLIKRTVKQ